MSPVLVLENVFLRSVRTFSLTLRGTYESVSSHLSSEKWFVFINLCSERLISEHIVMDNFYCYTHTHTHKRACTHTHMYVYE